MKAKTCILSLLALVMGPCLLGQTWYFRHLQVENGLSNNAVICSLQDKRGFLWFGTKDGLDRYDGYSFKVFRNDPDDSSSIGSNFIHALYEDPDGAIWVGTEKGLYRFDAATERFSQLPGSGNGPIRDVCTDGGHNLWFISGFSLFKSSPAAKQPQYFPIDSFFEATSLCVTAGGTLWATSSHGFLYRYQDNTFKAFDCLPTTRSDRWIERAYPTSDSTILIGTAVHGALIFDTRTLRCKAILTYNPDKTAIFVRNFVAAGPNEYWIATESGIYIYNRVSGKITNLRKQSGDPYSISDNAVYTFCKDREGGIWAGTYFGGINYYPGQYNSFKKYFPKSGENSLGGYVVREIHQDSHGDLFIGTEDAGLDKLDPADGHFTHYQPTGARGSISYSNIHGLLVHGNDLWIGTFEHGLDIMDIRTGKIVRHYGEGAGDYALKSSFIYCITRTRDDHILLGTTRGAYVYDPRHDGFTPLPGMPLNNWYSSLLEDNSGAIWAGTFGNGVNYYDPHNGVSKNFRYDGKSRNSLASDRVNSIYRDSRNRLWFATEGGLCRWDADAGTSPASSSSPSSAPAGHFIRYTIRDGFPTDFILAILEDDNGNLWISTSKGLVSFNPDTKQLTVFTRENGLLNDQFNFSSAFRDTSGRMYFGSVKGMISFNPREFRKNTVVPPVYITGFQVDNHELPIGKDQSPLHHSISFTDKIILDHSQSTFSIDFAALGFTAPERAEYAYEMEGLDKDWIELKKNRKAYFTGLAPGHYTFKVKASNNSGIWVDHETRLDIDILPPWWAGPVAYGCYILAGLLLIWYFVRSYHRRVEEKNRRKIEQLETAKEKEILNAKIEFFTNVAHEIKTPLTLIKGPMEKLLKKMADLPGVGDSLKVMDRNTNRLIDLTNQLLDFRQTEIKGFSLSFVRANISLLLEENYAGFRTLAEQNDLRFDLRLPPNPLFAFVDIDAFNKILANLFGNAIKYGTSKTGVTLLQADASFTIEVYNDGFVIPPEMREKIFEPFFRLKETEKKRGTGIGLALARSLAQLHKGALELKTPRDGMNIFSLCMPIHQDREFDLQIASHPLHQPNSIIP